MLTKHSGRDALVSVSLANLCLLRVWTPLLLPNESEYFAKTAYDRIDYISILLNLALLASLFFSFSRVARSCDKGWLRILAQVTFLLCLLPLFDFARRYLGLSYSDFLRFGFPGLIIGASGFGVLIFLLRVQLCRYAYAVLLYTIPFAALTSAQALWHVANRDWPHPVTIALEKRAEPSDKPRVVWIIFDEWDQQVTFDRRPTSLQLPNIDAFARSSFLATNAYPPSGGTLVSIPSLLTGSLMAEVRPESYAQLLIRAVGEEHLSDFRQHASILSPSSFPESRLAVAGWYHPYSRLIPTGANIAVHWENSLQLQGFRAEGFCATIMAQLSYALMPYLIMVESPGMYGRIHAFAVTAVCDPNIDVIFLHYPIPHLPGIYESSSGKVGLQLKREYESHFANLALVDRTLGEILAALDGAKLRNRTAIILSSDHWWRASPLVAGERSHRVPFLIQLPEKRERRVFDLPINTVRTLGVVQEILRGSVQNYDQLLAYFGNADRESNFRFDSEGYIHVN